MNSEIESSDSLATTATFRIPSMTGPVGIKYALDSVLPSGDLVYHFTSLVTGLEKILPSRSLRFAPLTGTNDPLEFEEVIPIATGSVPWSDPMPSLRHGEEIKSLRKKALLTCYCSERFEKGEDDSKGWKRVRMWSQYGENHRGVCLVFHKERLENAIRKTLPESRVFLSDRIDYLGEYQIGRMFLSSMTIKREDCARESAHDRLVRDAKALLFSKLHDFRDEREWRMALVPRRDDELSEYFVCVQDCLQAVILGSKFPDVYESAVLEMTDVDVFRVEWFHGRADLRALKRSAFGAILP